MTKLLQMRLKLPDSLIRFVIFQVSHLLLYLKSEGIVYRDLKLSNVLIDSNFICKIVDFGLSKRIMKEQTFSICGTPHALPPEVFSSQGYSYEIDCYALGVLTIELITGSAPFGYHLDFEDIKHLDFDKMRQELTQKIKDKKALDFVLGLVEKDITKRSNLETAIDHEFLAFTPIIQAELSIEDFIKKIANELKHQYIEISEDIELIECRAEEDGDDIAQPSNDLFDFKF